MSKELSDLGASGLRFFGSVTASISHEIKNVLAIVNENAGLLGDLILMAEKGKPLNLERVGKIAEALKRSVTRSDTIIKNLNKFAHSIDHEVGETDVGEMITFATALFSRLAAMRSVTLVPEPPKEPLIVTTHRFFLQQLLWRCIDVAVNAVGVDKTVRIAAELVDTGALVRFRGLDNLGSEPTAVFSSKTDEAVLNVLKAKLTTNVEGGEVVLSIPAQTRI